MWKLTGKQRPEFAVEPEPGQESVWDYPRPPALREDSRLVEVRAAGRLLASSNRCIRICETASPPTFYIPIEDVAMELLVPAAGDSFCEWKGRASYWALQTDPANSGIAWSYAQPRAAFSDIRDCLSFYPGKIACFVAGERVRPQPGNFYGGWVTNEIVGPFKGEPGTSAW